MTGDEDELPPGAGEQIRHVMLAFTLAELCRLDVADVVQPTCPHCAEGPAMALPAGQAFCGNDSCDVFTWQITEDAAAFDRNARRLIVERDDAGRETWRPSDDPEDPGLRFPPGY